MKTKNELPKVQTADKWKSTELTKTIHGDVAGLFKQTSLCVEAKTFNMLNIFHCPNFMHIHLFCVCGWREGGRVAFGDLLLAL